MNYQLTPRERLEVKPVQILAPSKFVELSKKRVLASNPEHVIEFINEFFPGTLDSKKEEHFGLAHDSVYLSMLMN